MAVQVRSCKIFILQQRWATREPPCSISPSKIGLAKEQHHAADLVRRASSTQELSGPSERRKSDEQEALVAGLYRWHYIMWLQQMRWDACMLLCSSNAAAVMTCTGAQTLAHSSTLAHTHSLTHTHTHTHAHTHTQAHTHTHTLHIAPKQHAKLAHTHTQQQQHRQQQQQEGWPHASPGLPKPLLEGLVAKFYLQIFLGVVVAVFLLNVYLGGGGSICTYVSCLKNQPRRA